MLTRSLLLTCLLAAFWTPSTAAATQIYRIVDEHGNVTFTDRPARANDATETVEMDAPNTFDIDEVMGKGDELWMSNIGAQAEPLQAEELTNYSVARILSPGNDQSIRENAGNITVISRTEPELHSGHALKLLLDGAPHQGRPSGTTFKLTNVDRGTHQIAIQIVDQTGAVLFTGPSSTFHMMRAIAARAAHF